MNAAWVTMVLVGSVLAPATNLTGRELALLRVILRQSMSTDLHAASGNGDALTRDRFSPLGRVSNDPNLPYTNKEIAAIVTTYFGYMVRPVRVRGPLTVADAEQRDLQLGLDRIAQLGISDLIRVPFWGLEDAWLSFKKQMRTGDLLYYFTTDEIYWGGLVGAEGYVLIREGKVVETITTGLS